MDDVLLGPLERRGRYIQLTSFGRGAPVRWGYLEPWFEKCVILRPGEEHVAAEAGGAGVLTRLFVTLPTFWRRALFREIVVRIWWDGEPAPSVEAPLGDFFGIHFCRYRPYASRLFTVLSGGLSCAAPMPFARGFRVSFTQEGRFPVPMFFYGLGYSELESAPTPLRFHAAWRREALVPRGAPFTFLEARGRGYYAGVHLSAQNRDLWLLSPPWRWPFPRGFGLGNLEGVEDLAVDGRSTHRGTGHEEYFNTGWYFRDGAAAAPDFGCLGRSYLTGRAAAYRYHWRDPIPFRESFRGTIAHGLANDIPSDYAATAYWYQEEPHAPHELPPVEARRLVNPLLGRRWG